MPAINWGRHHASLRARFAPRIAVQDSQGDATYAEILDHAAGLARALIETGTRPGAKIATLMRNSRLAVAASYGIQLAGAAEIPLNIAYTEAERREALATAGCTTVICAPEHTQFFRDHKYTTHDITTARPETLDGKIFPDVPPHFPGRIGFTSGTTGRPKAIVTSQQARFIGNLLLQASLPWLPGPNSRCLLMTPFAHGASLQSFAWLNQGGTVILHDGVDPDRVRPLLESRAVEAMFAAPTVLAKLTAAYAGREYTGLRTIFTGTAPLPPLLYARTRAMFGPIVRVTYGKSEVVNPIAILRPEETDAYFAESSGQDGSTCVGWPGQGVEIMIDGPGEEGEILLRAQHMSDGILDANHTVIPWREDGFHPTGDIGRIDPKGRLHLVARLSDAMKTGGYKVYPQEIERAAAMAHPAGAADTTIIGFPSEYWGEIIVAVAENPAPNWETATRAACADLAPYKRPRFYAALDSLPRNGQGKIVRRHIIAALQQQWRLIDGPRPTFERLP